MPNQNGTLNLTALRTILANLRKSALEGDVPGASVTAYNSWTFMVQAEALVSIAESLEKIAERSA